MYELLAYWLAFGTVALVPLSHALRVASRRDPVEPEGTPTSI